MIKQQQRKVRKIMQRDILEARRKACFLNRPAKTVRAKKMEISSKSLKKMMGSKQTGKTTIQEAFVKCFINENTEN
jgi:hypothetical protein